MSGIVVPDFRSKKYFLRSLYSFSRNDRRLAVNCLGITDHNDIKNIENSSLELLCYSNGRSCLGKENCREVLYNDNIKEYMYKESSYRAVSVSSGHEHCGVFTIDSNFSEYNTQLRQFIEDFKYYYRQFYIYQLSLKYLDKNDPITIIGRSQSLRTALNKIESFSASEQPVLISGETGTGKELWASSIHLRSTRRKGPFILVNCSHFKDVTLAISSLFGHKKGAFTGANYDHRGFFLQADGGTIFLDEIGDLHLETQGILLRTIESGEVQRLGYNLPTRVNVRLVAATNKDLRSEIDKGRFRQDIYYRIKVFEIHLPPLRECGDQDIIQLAYNFLNQLNHKEKRNKSIDNKALNMIINHNWPGNVRELKNTITYAFYKSDINEIIQITDLPNESSNNIPYNIDTHSPIVVVKIISLYQKMVTNQESFWQVVYEPYIKRQLNKDEVKQIIDLGLKEVGRRPLLRELFMI